MIYLDYQATTPLAPEAREAMLPWLAGPEGMGFANPHSPHKPGRAAAAAVEVAREQLAALLPPDGRVVFTSGATEALNLAILGRKPKQIVVSNIEHSAVINAARATGAPIQVLEVGADGLLDPDTAFAPGSDIVCVMQANNEIGVIQPTEELARKAHAKGALFVCDAVQGYGKIAAPAEADMIAITGHKMYGPKGIGALWLRDGVHLDPIVFGGGQEGGLRSGTLSPALCAGFGAAAALAKDSMEEDAAHCAALFSLVLSLMPHWQLNGSADHRWKGNVNLRRDGLDVGRLMSECRDIAFSAGSACASGKGEPSRVLSAIGLPPEALKSSIRLGFGRYTTRREIEDACAILNAAAAAQGV
ncbi:cysteine desulfurase family protein [Novosphingobium sp.]|uniref:cysteine desulfurase family protein n=1 Tax=Novosphingobium sp. TaxID=1874826 RepID=UPI00286EA57C|nr:cysteine desulfurase family protein [Novosphingobium sp.]